MGNLALLATAIIPYVVIIVLITGIGVGTGHVLRWLFDIDLGTAIVSGTIAASVAFYYTAKFLKMLYSDVSDEFAEDDEDDDSPPVVYLVDPLTRRNRRKKKRK